LRDNEKQSDNEADVSKIYIAKNRHGGEGMITLQFRGEYQRFESPSDRKE